jgi:tRNA pseudouridine38-40 synthase
MYYYKTTIMYEGTDYAGFQWQQGLRTIQGDINSALEKILKEKFTTKGASRTDTGVHAYEQIVKISSIEEIHISTFVEQFNNTLPRSIRCLKVESCSGLFSPSSESKSKEYRYFFTNKKIATNEETQFMAIFQIH